MMKWLHYYLLLASALLPGFARANQRSNEAGPNGKPNIIYILADDLGYGDLSCYGQKKFQTPFIDQMASGGMLFTQHYAGSTVCAPSRSSLLTGLHTGHTYIRGNREVKPEGQFPLPDSAITVAELLKQSGYSTAIIGKWGLGYPGSTGVPGKQGFDKFFGYNCQREAHHYFPEYLWRNTERVMLDQNRNGMRGMYSHDLFAAGAVTFIRENAARKNPFFLYLPFTIPHADLDVPDRFMEAFRGKFEEKPFPGNNYIAQPNPYAAFAAMITLMDRDVGKLLALLVELNIHENTLVIFSSDNGPHNEGGADPGFFDSNGPLRGSKRDVYEGAIRVPMIAWWPGKIKPGSSSDHISAFWDFMPTACELAGAETPADIDGISFLPALLGFHQKQHRYLYWEFHEEGGKQAVRKSNWKAIRKGLNDGPDAPVELYDLSEDPGEEKNVAAEFPEVMREMKQIMLQAHRENPVWLFAAQRE